MDALGDLELADFDDDGDAVWRPRLIYVRWDARFQTGLRNVYTGLFLENEARFEHGLAALKLGSAGSYVNSAYHRIRAIAIKISKAGFHGKTKVSGATSKLK